jgi:DNA-binding CsgD family transcriptional regulator
MLAYPYNQSFHAEASAPVTEKDRLNPASLRTRFGLTTREAEVLHWVAQAKRNGEIAIILGISERTVQKHMERILATLGVENRTAAANVAREFL